MHYFRRSHSLARSWFSCLLIKNDQQCHLLPKNHWTDNKMQESNDYREIKCSLSNKSTIFKDKQHREIFENKLIL